jgi:hypothetical protein
MAVAVGELHLGVRPGDAELAARLGDALRAHTVGGLDPPANFSVRFAGPLQHRRGAGFHMLYRGCGLVLRTRDPRRLLGGLFRHLDAFRPEYGADWYAIRSVALVGDGRALIAPFALRSWMPRIERRLNIRGLRFVDMPWVLLDTARVEIVVPDLGLDVDWSALEGLEAAAPASRPDPAVPAGRYALTGWTFLGDGEPLSRARAVALASRSTSGHGSAQATLDALASVMRAIEPTSLPWSAPAELVDALAERS